MNKNPYITQINLYVTTSISIKNVLKKRRKKERSKKGSKEEKKKKRKKTINCKRKWGKKRKFKIHLKMKKELDLQALETSGANSWIAQRPRIAYLITKIIMKVVIIYNGLLEGYVKPNLHEQVFLDKFSLTSFPWQGKLVRVDVALE